jgi:hypothetical protein
VSHNTRTPFVYSKPIAGKTTCRVAFTLATVGADGATTPKALITEANPPTDPETLFALETVSGSVTEVTGAGAHTVDVAVQSRGWLIAIGAQHAEVAGEAVETRVTVTGVTFF